MEELMLAIGHWWLHLIGWKPKTLRAYEQLQLSYSDEAIAGTEALSRAIHASKITLGATHQEIEPYQPQPEYEGMQFAQADWKPDEHTCSC